ncbi:hypothetical protein FA95DRAFT_770517 [Auriscalpium vulgare]|uniref:Uncharacterized protein n=1 Tax=Auriscalpium vulgare TaxID=40419 RepID=A0ACB8RAY8_9AGAM|nr:hypothetical protein FA95DRAFT_770517 [Auriscalpium vulgare]
MSGLPMEPVTLPPSLRHVGYHTYNLYANAPVPAELVLDPLSALPELQLVTVTAWVGQHVCAALEVMCREKGVDFGIYEFPYDWNLKILTGYEATQSDHGLSCDVLSPCFVPPSFVLIHPQHQYRLVAVNEVDGQQCAANTASQIWRQSRRRIQDRGFNYFLSETIT